MNKRILTLVLALVMILGLAVTSFAAPEAEKITNPKVQWLIDKNIVVGRLQDDGKTTVYDLDKTITREEVAKLVILYRGSENLARSLQGTKGIFKDVAIDRWSNGYINVAALADLIVGYPDGNFGPDKDITYAEIAAILVRMNSKWTAADEKAAIWPISFIKAAEEFGILKGIKLEDANAPAVREKVFEMMYNAFDGKYQAPIVNDRLGVVSRIWGDSIQLNGDTEYKVTKDTIFVGKSLNVLYTAKDFFGSLVRIAVNNDNEITHLVVLGSDKLAQPADKWDGIIDEKAGKVFVEKTDTAVPADIAATSDNDKVIFVGGPTLKITDKTRFFVADTKHENFFEAKKLSDAIDTSKPAHLKGVYAAYDKQPVTGELYAKVVVFSEGKEAKANKNLARITASVAAGYDFKAENTGAVETEYSVAKANKFPYNYKLHKMDVVNLHMSGDKDVVNFDVKIDYDNDPVYEVVKISDARYQNDGTIKFEGNSVVLKDKHDKEKTFALDVNGVSVFTNALGKGAKVQIHYADKNKQVIDIISKVDKKVDGDFGLYKPNEVCGTLQLISSPTANTLVHRIHIVNAKDNLTHVFDIDGALANKLVAEINDAANYGPGAYAIDTVLTEKKIGLCVTVAETAKTDTVTGYTLKPEELAACQAARAEVAPDTTKLAALDAAATLTLPPSPSDYTAAKAPTFDTELAKVKDLVDFVKVVKGKNAASICYDVTVSAAIDAKVTGYETHLGNLKTANAALDAQEQAINSFAKTFDKDSTTITNHLATLPTVTGVTVTDSVVSSGDTHTVTYTLTATGYDASWVPARTVVIVVTGE